MMLYRSQLTAPSTARPRPAFAGRCRRPGSSRVFPKAAATEPRSQEDVVQLVSQLRADKPGITVPELYARIKDLHQGPVLDFLPPPESLAIRDLRSMAPLWCYAHAKEVVDAMLSYRPYDKAGYRGLAEPRCALFLLSPVSTQSSADQPRESARQLINVYAVTDHLEGLKDVRQGPSVEIKLPSSVRMIEVPAAQPVGDFEEVRWDSWDLLKTYGAKSGSGDGLVGLDHPIFGSSMAEALAAAFGPGSSAPGVSAFPVTVVDKFGQNPGAAWVLRW